MGIFSNLIPEKLKLIIYWKLCRVKVEDEFKDDKIYFKMFNALKLKVTNIFVIREVFSSVLIYKTAYGFCTLTIFQFSPSFYRFLWRYIFLFSVFWRKYRFNTFARNKFCCLYRKRKKKCLLGKRKTYLRAWTKKNQLLGLFDVYCLCL